MALEAPFNIKVIGKKLVLDELLGPYDGNSSGKVGFFYFSKSGTPYPSPMVIIRYILAYPLPPSVDNVYEQPLTNYDHWGRGRVSYVVSHDYVIFEQPIKLEAS